MHEGLGFSVEHCKFCPLCVAQLLTKCLTHVWNRAYTGTQQASGVQVYMNVNKCSHLQEMAQT